jgi:hypothetical protein
LGGDLDPEQEGLVLCPHRARLPEDEVRVHNGRDGDKSDFRDHSVAQSDYVNETCHFHHCGGTTNVEGKRDHRNTIAGGYNAEGGKRQPAQYDKSRGKYLAKVRLHEWLPFARGGGRSAPEHTVEQEEGVVLRG